ncbi:MAG: hypothetical protein J6T22_06850, partial [Bacteroidales bacterium]|nr:hypothetical protein [Bacteroidales bacterium]
IRPAASVHPEPGSNSSLYYCLSFVFTLNLGFRLDVLLCSFSRVRITPSRPMRTVFLCWPQAFNELYASSSPQSYPSFLGEADCKGTTFFNIGNQKNQLFLIKYYICLSFNDIKILFHKEMR